MPMVNRYSSLLLAAAVLGSIAACGAGSGADAGPDLAPDVGDTITPTDLPGDTTQFDLPTDVPEEAAAPDIPTDPGPPEGLPESLPFAFTRPDDGTPLTGDEVAAFTRKMLGFLRQIHYFDYVLYTTHGVDASTGKRDWQFWYSEQFRKAGDLVTFYHPPAPDGGGHNLHIPMSHVLGDVVAAALVNGDPSATLAATQLCKGMTASMLGMVHDANDPLPHLMSRNVVPGWNQEFDTHDGKRKAVDTSGWWSPYTRWNTDRFQVTDNPYWGAVWVTNLRSKDDVPHIFQVVPVLRYAAASAKDPAMQTACAESLSMLTAFAKDIVDSDYRIRTKDENGDVYIPGYTGDLAVDGKQGDIASFTYWRDLIPNGECNARRGAELVGYHHPIVEDCGRGEPNDYDAIAFTSNSYNKKIIRYFHLAHLANALVNRDDAAAALLLDGLDERVAQDTALPEADMGYTPAVYRRELALYLAQLHAYGYPLTSTQARSVQQHFARAADELAAWPTWDPWAASVPDGDLGPYRPPSCKGSGTDETCWIGVEDLAHLFEACWSPLVNPAGARWVDCDIVRDPSKWDLPTG